MPLWYLWILIWLPLDRALSHNLSPTGLDEPLWRSTMADSRYAALPDATPTNPQLGRLAPPDEPSSPSPSRSPGSMGHRRSLASESDTDSDDVSYRDVLDTEPFDEKVRVAERFQDEPNMEDGEEGYAVEPSRVGLQGLRRRDVALIFQTASTSQEVTSCPRCFTRYTPLGGLYRCSRRVGIFCSVVFDQIWQSAYHPGSHSQWDFHAKVYVHRLGQRR